MTSDTCIKADTIGGFPFAEPNCKGCGKPLELNNAWMTDGCPCNTPLGVNSMNETRWRLLMQLQQNQSRSIEALMKQTTPTINGLRLVTPEEAGYKDVDMRGYRAVAVVMKDDRPFHFYDSTGSVWLVRELIPLPKPRTTRPYKRGEVKLGDMFRNKEDGYDKIVSCVTNRGVDLGCIYCSYSDLVGFYHRLTYDADGKEVISVAGVEE